MKRLVLALFVVIGAFSFTQAQEDIVESFERDFRKLGVPIKGEIKAKLDELRVTNDKARWNNLVHELDELVGKLTGEKAEHDRKARLAKAEQDRKARLAEATRKQKQRAEELARLNREIEATKAALEAEKARLVRLQTYCGNGFLYFRKTYFGFGSWVEEDEKEGTVTPISEFDHNNDVLNRLMELKADGWGNKIPAKTVACGEGDQALYDVLR